MSALLKKHPALLFLTVAALALWSARNYPWHLEEYDEAKQAFASLSALNDGHWWVQRLPSGAPASKPPLLAWCSAALRAAGLRWDLAWRLPSLASALAALLLVMAAANRLAGPAAAAAAGAAFALNLMTLRIATLARTDMPLALLCLVAGLALLFPPQIPPSGRRLFWRLSSVSALAHLVKGPVFSVFYLAAALGTFLTRGRARRGAVILRLALAALLLSLAPLLVWSLTAPLAHSDFSERIVGKEFLSRLDSGPEAAHKAQPLWFYLPQLVRGWFPWALALPGLFCLPRVRSAFRRDRRLLMLALWAGAAVLVLSLIPSKRLDRIYPVIAPLSILFGALAVRAPLPQSVWPRLVMPAALALAALYTGLEIARAHSHHTGALKSLAAEGRHLSARLGIPLLLERSGEEALPCYLETTKTFSKAAILAEAESARRFAAIVREPSVAALTTAGARPLRSARASGKRGETFVLVLVSAAPPPDAPFPPHDGKTDPRPR